MQFPHTISNDKRPTVSIALLPPHLRLTLVLDNQTTQLFNGIVLLSLSLSRKPRWKYDVFLSFRGEDTRKTFVDHLYLAFRDKGIHTFKDDEQLQRGKWISPELIDAIEESQFALIIFSENYASSSWCLDELVEIMECKNSKGLTVWPVFYHVDPSRVRKQTGSFAEAFAKHAQTFWEDEEKVQRWRAALVEASNISGWDLKDLANGHEGKFIQQIVQGILRELRQTTPLNVTQFGVGIDVRAYNLIMLLANRSKDVCMIGVCGTGGIGKTTIAKVVFNTIFHIFESCCFLENVREESKQQGLRCLQQGLLEELLKEKEFKISNVDCGINALKNRLRCKMVLIVLDDVDNSKQLKSLAGESDWFGSGSIIIITTRDERLLVEHKVDEIYKCELLDDNEALQLFSWHAFLKDHPLEEYKKLSYRAINYAKGLPLALEVLGSFLHKRSKQEWEAQLDKLKRIPNRHIQDILQLSFDALDDIQKDIFLDIACFFKGWKKEYVMNLLESCDFYPNIEIKVLIERSLITISDTDDTIRMHDLIQDMGMEIVRQESPKDPGKRTRLWVYEDICEVLTENMVTNSIEGIVMDESEGPTINGLHVSANVFSKMMKLRMLKISNVQLYGGPPCLSDELTYLDWKGYPERHLPSNFNPKKLVKLHLCGSNIKQLWMGKKFLDKLKYLDLRECQYLEKTPDFSGLSCLEELHLNCCKRLVEVHQSIAVHDRMCILDLSHCKNLKRLPRSIGMKNLMKLNLNGCSKLEKFPEIQEGMNRLQMLGLNGTGIEDLPSSIEHLNGLLFLFLSSCRKLKTIPTHVWRLKSLKYIYFSGCPKLKKLPEIERNDETATEESPSSTVKLRDVHLLNLMSTMPSSFERKKIPYPSRFILVCAVADLVLSYFKLSEGSLPNYAGCWQSSLTHLYISGNNFGSIPASFTQLKNLECLDLQYCTKLQTLTSLPSSIREVKANGCSSLKQFRFPPRQGVKVYQSFEFNECHKLPASQLHAFLSDIHDCEIMLTGSEIPGWLEHRWERVEFPHPNTRTILCSEVDHLPCKTLTAICLCLVLECKMDHRFLGFDLYINGSCIVEEYSGQLDKDSDYGVILRYLTLSESCKKKLVCHGSSRVLLHLFNESTLLPPDIKPMKIGLHLIWKE